MGMRDLPGWLSELWRAATGTSSPPARVGTTREPARLIQATEPALVYAVGDVHGRLDLLKRLEDVILVDRARLQQPAFLVLLGDLVDRGPSSAQVLDHVLSPPPEGVERICLMGNHEAMMLDFLENPGPEGMWLSQGGRETLLSYGLPSASLERPTRLSLMPRIRANIPDAHIEFLRAMPVMLKTPTHVYVHAGIDSSLGIDDQPTDTLLWYRDDFIETYEGLGHCVVHGHSVSSEPLVTDHRIAVDTGACRTGTLSAVAIAPGVPVRVFSVTEPGRIVR